MAELKAGARSSSYGSSSSSTSSSPSMPMRGFSGFSSTSTYRESPFATVGEAASAVCGLLSRLGRFGAMPGTDIALSALLRTRSLSPLRLGPAALPILARLDVLPMLARFARRGGGGLKLLGSGGSISRVLRLPARPRPRTLFGTVMLLKSSFAGSGRC